MRRKAVLLVATALLLGVPGAAWAQRPAPIGAHQHFIVQPDGSPLPVGPDICANPDASQGFYGFHQNIHFGTPRFHAFQQPNNPIGFTAVNGCL